MVITLCHRSENIIEEIYLRYRLKHLQSSYLTTYTSGNFVNKCGSQLDCIFDRPINLVIPHDTLTMALDRNSVV